MTLKNINISSRLLISEGFNLACTSTFTTPITVLIQNSIKTFLIKNQKQAKRGILACLFKLSKASKKRWEKLTPDFYNQKLLEVLVGYNKQSIGL